MLKRFVLASLLMLANVILPAHAYDINNCDATARADIKTAADFLEANMSTLVDRYTFLTEEQRQEIIRKWARLKIRCADNDNTCSSNTLGRAHGGPGNTINVCYYNEVRIGSSLCDLAQTIMHEQGHAHGFRMVPGHNNPTQYVFDNDPMYRMGSMALNFCEYRAAEKTFTDAALKGVGSRAIGASCTADLQCASSRCSQNQCVCDEDVDCASGQRCFKPATARNYCSNVSLPIGATCTREDQCLSNQCENQTCVCRHDSDCPTGQTCRTPITGSNRCERPDDPIGAAPVGAACTSDRNCLSNKCDSNRCVCNSDADCAAGTECYRPIGAPNQCRAVGLNLGASCQRDSQCRSGKCEDDECVCRHDDDCGPGFKCKTPITGKNRCEK